MYFPKRNMYKVLVSISRRIVLPVLACALGILLLDCIYLLLSSIRQKNILLFESPLIVRVLNMGVGSKGSSIRDRESFIRKYGLYPSTDENLTVREFLLYGTFDDMEAFPELSGILQAFADKIPGFYRPHALVSCSDTQIGLTVSTSFEEFDSKDAIVFGMMPRTLAQDLEFLVEKEPPIGQTWIYYSTESPFRVLRWVKDNRLAKLKYHKLMTYNSDADIYFPFGHTVTNTHVNFRTTGFMDQNFAKGKKKLMAWMASNCEEIFWPRNEFVERIRELVRVDTYGRCGATDCLPRGSEECKRVMSQYKFYLSLANTECRDYITETFWDTALLYGIVPVVGGAPREDFERIAPPNSFIHIADFKSIKNFVDYLLLLDKNDDMYNEYFQWRKTTRVVNQFPPKPEIFCQILKHLGETSDKVIPSLKVLADSPWFTTCRNQVSISSAVRVRSRVIDNNFDTWSPWRL